MQITPDFSETAEQELIPIGEYQVMVKGVEPKVSKAGNDMLLWKYEIQGAVGDYEKFNGRWLFDNTMVSGKGAFRLKNTLEAVIGEARAFETEEVLGQSVRVVVNHEQYNDQTKAAVVSIAKI